MFETSLVESHGSFDKTLILNFNHQFQTPNKRPKNYWTRSAKNTIEGHIHGLYLTPEVLNMGLGVELVTLMLDKAKEMGSVSVILESTITAHDFYKRIGFKDSGAVKRIDIAGHPVTCFPMILELRQI